MGIVFGKSKADNVRVLTIKETQSMPVVRMDRKFGKSRKDNVQKQGRSTSYQTGLPGLPNLISSDEESKSPVPVPPPFTLPPVSQKRHGSKGRRRSPTVVAELSTSNSEEYSSCVEDLGSHVQREKTILIKEILGKRLDELRVMQKHGSAALSSRESRKFISSRDSYRKTCLKSRKRSKRNGCLSDSSLSNSFIRDEDTINPSGDDDTLSDVKGLIIDKPAKRNITGYKISRKSTLNSAIRYNSSSDEGLPDQSIRYHVNKREQRVTRRVRTGAARSARTKTSGKVTIKSGKLAGSKQSKVRLSGKQSGVRVSSAWHKGEATSSKLITKDVDCYDAASELSSTDSEDDELNYSKRFKTNPFLRSTSTNLLGRHDAADLDKSLQTAGPSQKPRIQAGLGNILPNYAKSSYDEQHSNFNKTLQSYFNKHTSDNTVSTDFTSSLSSETQFRVKGAGKTSGKGKKCDEFDDLDSAVEMFKHLL